MAYTYSALILYTDSDGRFANLTGTPTVTAFDLAGNAIASPTILNLATGVYKVEVTQNDVEDVLFRVVPHADDQADFPDVAVMQDKVVHTLAGLAPAGEYDADFTQVVELLYSIMGGEGWTDESLVTIQAAIDLIKAKTDALDISAVNFVTVVNGTTITIVRGDTLEGSLTDLGDLTDYVSIDFTVKERYADTDDEAIIRIRKNASGADDGLLRFNGEVASSAALGSIAIDDLVSGDITITLDETMTDDLDTGTYVYDIQKISAAGVRTLTYGKVIVSADVTRLVA